VIMLGSGLLWGYLIGVFCSLAGASPSVQAFRDELSQLNSFMATYNLPRDVRYRLREFLHETIHLRDAQARAKLIAKLSPAMQGEVALLVNQEWISKVWYLRKNSQLEMLIELGSRLQACVFAPWELCPTGAMYICHRGTGLFAARPRHPGSIWGDDVLLADESIRLNFCAVATSYLWVYTLDSHSLHSAISKFPNDEFRLRGIARRWTIRRAVVRAAERLCYHSGQMFRERKYPIYARELAAQILRWQEEMESRHRRKRLVMYGGKVKAMQMFQKTTLKKREPQTVACSPSPSPRSKSPRSKIAPLKMVGAASGRVISLKGKLLRKTTTRNVATRDQPEQSATPSRTAQPRSSATRKCASRKNVASVTHAQSMAANSFGLHLREEACRKAMEHERTVPALFDEVRQLREDFNGIQESQASMVAMLKQVASAISRHDDLKVQDLKVT